MKETNILLCPKLKTKEDISCFEERMFVNICRLQARVEAIYQMGGQTLCAKDVADLLNMILEVEEVNVSEERKALSSDCGVFEQPDG